MGSIFSISNKHCVKYARTWVIFDLHFSVSGHNFWFCPCMEQYWSEKTRVLVHFSYWYCKPSRKLSLLSVLQILIWSCILIMHKLPDFHNRSFKKNFLNIFRKLWSVVQGTVKRIHICIPLSTLVLKNKTFRNK